MSEPSVTARPLRLLFCSFHCLVDPASGAAVCMSTLLQFASRRGWEATFLCGPRTDTDPDRLPWRLGEAVGARPSLLPLRYRDVQGLIVGPRAVDRSQVSDACAATLLGMLDQYLERERPDIVLTYGGDAPSRMIRQRVQQQGIPLIFWLHNPDYFYRETFAGVDGIVVPSEFLAAHYRAQLGLAVTAIPPPIDWGRVVADRSDGRFVTFVNPEPTKGLGVFARIARELDRRRPDIPFLAVEGRGGLGWLNQPELELKGCSNVHIMKTTSDPRKFYGQSRIVLVPSLWPEASGLVAAEAMINGLPVLASRRGGLAETLGDAGFLFDLPAKYTGKELTLPSAEEVAPWIDHILRLWDDAAFYETARARARIAAHAYREDILMQRYEAFFLDVVARRASGKNEFLTMPSV